ncbi:MAG: protein translocase subunit SecF [Methylococcaceae bacterium]|nr:protein translocase subunit SecF [Methylococcaceae bacterium]
MNQPAPRLYKIDFLGKRHIAVWASVILSIAAIVSLAAQGLNFAIDFTGGTVVEVEFVSPADVVQIRQNLETNGFNSPMVQLFGTTRDVLIRLAPQENLKGEELKNRVMGILNHDSANRAELHRIEFVGPQVGEDLVEDSGLALLYASIGILIYVALRFEYRFSLGAILATLHDVIMILGFFSVLQLEFDLSVLAAVLTIMGYSLNDTIVVFDRIRENFRKLRRGEVVEVMNISINETLNRTLMTSFLTFLTVLAMALFGGEIIHNFAIALLIGIVVGTYSSIYVASALALKLGVSRADLLVPEKEGAADNRP